MKNLHRSSLGKKEKIRANKVIVGSIRDDIKIEVLT